MEKIVLFCFVAVLCVFSVFRETAQNSRVKIVNFSFFISKDIQMFNFDNINGCKQWFYVTSEKINVIRLVKHLLNWF